MSTVKFTYLLSKVRFHQHTPPSNRGADPDSYAAPKLSNQQLQKYFDQKSEITNIRENNDQSVARPPDICKSLPPHSEMLYCIIRAQFCTNFVDLVLNPACCLID